MTLTLNPLMGNLSSTYSVVVASRALTLSSCFDFNFYSYESELKLGLELWRKRRRSSATRSSAGAAAAAAPALSSNSNPNPNPNSVLFPNPVPDPEPKTEAKADPEEDTNADATTSGVLKARLDHRGAVALLWEGRAKDLLYGCGVVIDARRGEGMVRSVGIEISYSS